MSEMQETKSDLTSTCITFVIDELHKFSIIEEKSNFNDTTNNCAIIDTNADSIGSEEKRIRIAGNCPFCLDGKGFPTTEHSFRHCTIFKDNASMNLSKEPYIDKKLHDYDEQYFYASGVVPYRVKDGSYQILIISETRHNKTLYNYIGGKRDCYKSDNVYRLETSKETMTSEFCEEMKPLLQEHEFTHLMMNIDRNIHDVLWWSKSKLAIYLVPIYDFHSNSKDIATSIVTSTDISTDRYTTASHTFTDISTDTSTANSMATSIISSAIWVDLKSLDFTILHDYVKPIVEKIQEHLLSGGELRENHDLIMIKI